jgi:outer membrane lipoprotein-sorting protein
MVAQLLGLSLVLAAPAPPASASLDALSKRLSRIASIEASFQQRRTLSALKDELVSEGTMSWKRGAKLVWHTKSPTESEIIIDDRTAVLRFPSLNTEQSFDLSTQPEMAAIFRSILGVLSADVAALTPLFDVTVAGNQPLRLTLAPKMPGLAATIHAIHLELDGELKLERVLLDEAGGDKTDIVFRDQVIREVPR